MSSNNLEQYVTNAIKHVQEVYKNTISDDWDTQTYDAFNSWCNNWIDKTERTITFVYKTMIWTCHSCDPLAYLAYCAASAAWNYLMIEDDTFNYKENPLSEDEIKTLKELYKRTAYYNAYYALNSEPDLRIYECEGFKQKFTTRRLLKLELTEGK